MSFRFQCIKDDWRVDESDGITCRDLIEVRLMEVSPVTFPAYPETSISARSIAAASNKVSGNQDEALFRAIMGLYANAEITEEQRGLINDFAAMLQSKVKREDKPLDDSQHLEILRKRIDLETL